MDIQENIGLGDRRVTDSGPTESELLSRVEQSARMLGFDRFLIGLEIRRPLLDTIHHVTSIYPEEWRKRYQALGYTFKDPTVIHCQKRTTPLIWTDELYGNSRELWEEASSFGIKYGLSIGVHEGQGQKSMLSFTRDVRLDKDPHALAIMVAGAKVLSAATHFAATRLIAPSLIKRHDPGLTRREKECLKLAGTGLTAAKISDILKISEPTVVFHLNNVVRKLKVNSRAQAIAVGVALGIVH